MTWALVSFIAGIGVGVVISRSYARREIAKIKRDDISFQLARTIDHRSVEDRIRYAEGAS